MSKAYFTHLLKMDALTATEAKTICPIKSVYIHDM